MAILSKNSSVRKIKILWKKFWKLFYKNLKEQVFFKISLKKKQTKNPPKKPGYKNCSVPYISSFISIIKLVLCFHQQEKSRKLFKSMAIWKSSAYQGKFCKKKQECSVHAGLLYNETPFHVDKCGPKPPADAALIHSCGTNPIDSQYWLLFKWNWNFFQSTSKFFNKEFMNEQGMSEEWMSKNIQVRPSSPANTKLNLVNKRCIFSMNDVEKWDCHGIVIKLVTAWCIVEFLPRTWFLMNEVDSAAR